MHLLHRYCQYDDNLLLYIWFEVAHLPMPMLSFGQGVGGGEGGGFAIFSEVP